MNSLEYINNDIKTCKRLIKKLEKSIDTYDEVLQGPLDPIDQRFYRPKQDFIDQLDRYKNTLNILQQIKTILEAWEVCINDNAILDILKTLAKGESINWHRLPEEQQKIMQKALEVKDGK